ncbi:MAG: O-antigen ligase family protein [Acidobacteria bacterium]|uniref:O-antigen ligase family protein n=1 Tax=Candidatus Polarisedimenticola svalbardensis TaxID=2886004 RepID=A0A8J6Y5I3_9BACT|nr:O-antigen ligase family protein [Candidatus Polarisedimenticola svalbardensis]
MDGLSNDRMVRILEAGLCAVILIAPLPFGAVLPLGRTGLELAAAILLVLWLARALLRPEPGPGRGVIVSLVGMLALVLLQAVPLGAPLAGTVSPNVIAARQAGIPTGEALAAESRLLDTPPSSLEPGARLSLAPDSTVSALRTGAALAALLLVACTVGRELGLRRLAWAMALSAGFQGTHGALVLLSGHDQIWHIPKRYFLDCATGTFVNRGHFAIFVVACLAPAAAMALSVSAPAVRGGKRLAYWFGPRGGRNMLLRILVLLGAAGLLLSFSRHGTALGLLVLAWVWFRSENSGGKRRFMIPALLLILVAVPLLRFDPGRLADRYTRTAESLTDEAGRRTAWSDSLGIIRDYPVAGTGLGTFSQVYPSYRSPEIRRFFDHLHNDLLQWIVETGFIGLLLLLPLAWNVARRTAAAVGGRFGATAVGFGAGLAAIVLYSMFDFPFHLPAIAALAAILAGALLGIPCPQTTD